jgi:hypothetical protein
MLTGSNPGASTNRVVKALRAGRFVVCPPGSRVGSSLAITSGLAMCKRASPGRSTTERKRAGRYRRGSSTAKDSHRASLGGSGATYSPRSWGGPQAREGWLRVDLAVERKKVGAYGQVISEKQNIEPDIRLRHPRRFRCLTTTPTRPERFTSSSTSIRGKPKAVVGVGARLKPGGEFAIECPCLEKIVALARSPSARRGSCIGGCTVTRGWKTR